MNLLNVKDVSDEYFEAYRYYFETATSADDIRAVINILEMQGYIFSSYDVESEHDHTHDPWIEECDDINSLMSIINEYGLWNIYQIRLYGSVRGSFFPNEGIVNITTRKKIDTHGGQPCPIAPPRGVRGLIKKITSLFEHIITR